MKILVALYRKTDGKIFVRSSRKEQLKLREKRLAEAKKPK
jgi:hypothetical protein